MSWHSRPTFIDQWPDDADYTIFIDENGDPSLSHVTGRLKSGEEVSHENRYFAITACCVKKDDFPQLRQSVMEIKQSHWNDGLFSSQRVCLHSREIRRKQGAFHDAVIHRDKFLRDLTKVLSDIHYTISSYCVDKVLHVKRYSYPYHPYALCLDFLLERITLNQVPPGAKCIIVLEARGKDEDRVLLNHILQILKHGTGYRTPQQLENIIGVYFNPKRPIGNKEKSYFGLELADLVAYPIFKYFSRDEKDRAFLSICHKIVGYSSGSDYGLKRFP